MLKKSIIKNNIDIIDMIYITNKNQNIHIWELICWAFYQGIFIKE